MRVDILTIFPEIVQPYLNGSILGRAQEQGHQLKAVQLRDFAEGKHAQVDDTPYGGGAGMVLKVEPIHKAIKKLRPTIGKKKTRVIMTAASGKPFTQADARRLAEDYKHLIFICGRYEGIDQRVADHVADEIFSVGEYVLTGGELPAMTMTDAVMRNVPGVLGNKETLADESHDEPGKLEYPQYTKPEVYNKWKVPEVLLSGHHKHIEDWRERNRVGSEIWGRNYCTKCGMKKDIGLASDGVIAYCPNEHECEAYGGGSCEDKYWKKPKKK